MLLNLNSFLTIFNVPDAPIGGVQVLFGHRKQLSPPLRSDLPWALKCLVTGQFTLAHHKKEHLHYSHFQNRSNLFLWSNNIGYNDNFWDMIVIKCNVIGNSLGNILKLCEHVENIIENHWELKILWRYIFWIELIIFMLCLFSDSDLSTPKIYHFCLSVGTQIKWVILGYAWPNTIREWYNLTNEAEWCNAFSGLWGFGFCDLFVYQQTNLFDNNISSQTEKHQIFLGIPIVMDLPIRFPLNQPGISFTNLCRIEALQDKKSI